MADNPKPNTDTENQGGFRGTDTMESEKMRETGGQGGRGSQQDDALEPLGKSEDQQAKHKAGFQSPSPSMDRK